MTTRRRPVPDVTPVVDRRRMLLGLGTAFVAGGCTVPGSTSPSPSRGSPTPSATAQSGKQASTGSPLPGTVDGAQTETKLADYATAILDQRHGKLHPNQKRLLESLADAHRRHADVLQQTDPTMIESRASSVPSGPGSATPTSDASRIGDDTGKAIARLRSLERSAADHHRKRALHPPGPSDRRALLALLWGSLSTAASGYAAALADEHPAKPRITARHRKRVRPPKRTEAVQQLMRECHAVIFGIQAALGQLSGKPAKRAQHRLEDYRRLRDTARVWLDDHDGRVPEQKPAYRMPVQPKSSATAARLITTLEQRMLPYLGDWLATASTAHDRNTALHTLDQARSSADTWSSRTPVVIWPGWPTS